MSLNLTNTNTTTTKSNTSYQNEPLLTEEQRYTLHPIKHVDIWESFKKQEANFWTAEEVDLSSDKKDWNLLNDDERYFLRNILAFFAGSDGIVGVNILDNFSKDVKILEAQFAYSFQGTMEAIHSEMYSLLIDTYIDDIEEKNTLFNAITTIPCVSKKAVWALKWTNNSDNDNDSKDLAVSTNTINSFAKRLVAFAIVEGLFFSGSFCAIYWIKQRGILPGLTKANEWIARDEGFHTKFACLLYSKIINKLDQETIYEMISEAVEIETEFITESLPVKLIGMNNELMTDYIMCVADWLLVELGYEKKYNVKNPFLFIENLGIQSRSNFFDERTSTYQSAHVFNSSKDLVVVDDF
jgi:ribonucleoside-diphosphate reductase beta chain